MEELAFERMSVADIPDVVDLGRQTEEFRTGGNTPDFYGAERLVTWLNDDGGVLLVARADARLVGFAMSTAMSGPSDGYLHEIAVSSEMRRRGIGSELLRRTMAELANRGIGRLFCVVHAENGRAERFFEAHGMTHGPMTFQYFDTMLD